GLYLGGYRFLEGWVNTIQLCFAASDSEGGDRDAVHDHRGASGSLASGSDHGNHARRFHPRPIGHCARGAGHTAHHWAQSGLEEESKMADIHVDNTGNSSAMTWVVGLVAIIA